MTQSGNAIVGYRTSLQLAYNANHELTKSISITQEGLNLTEVITTYQYDAFGRRITKHSQTKDKTRLIKTNTVKTLDTPIQPKKTQHKHISYLWDGNRQRQEHTDTHVFTTVYEQDSFAPVARLVWLQKGLITAANDEPDKADDYFHEDEQDKPKTGIQVYHYHNDQLGTPNELTNDRGEVVWLADYEAWGNTAKVVWREESLSPIKVSSDELQPIRFQGQHFDMETGLHYNRFRYYDPDLGMFTTRDPIGLLGGNNVFQYAPNPTGWIDPWGLTNKPLNSPIFDKWVGKGGTTWSEVGSRTVVYKDWDGNVVRYPNGYPDFEGGGHVRQKIDVDDLKGNHGTSPGGDFGKADAAAPKGPKLANNTWHHHENGKTMQEIDKKIHNRFRHRGGVSNIKKDLC